MQHNRRPSSRRDNTIGIILFPIVLLLFSFTFLVFNTTFTDYLLNEEAEEPTHQLLKYFQNRAEMPEIFTEGEQSHLQDVKTIVWSAIISFFILVIALTYCIYKGNRYIMLKRGSILLIAIILLAIIIPFDFLFKIFHKIVFPQGNYIFPPDSTLIQFYPNDFFATYAISIAILSLIIAATLYLAEIVSRRG